MSLIDFPTVKLQEFNIEVQVPDVIQHSSIFTANELIHSRGNMYFGGRIGWAQRFFDRLEEIKIIEAFVVAVYGPVNTFKLPIPYDQSDRFDDATALTISAVTTNGTFESEFTATAGLKVGDWCNFGDRLHKIVEADGTSYKVVPGILNEDTTLKWHAPVLLARAVQTSIAMPRSGGRAGPWQIDVKEVV